MKTLSYTEAAERLLFKQPLRKHEVAEWTADSDEAGQCYFTLQNAVSRGIGIANVPDLFISVLKTKKWKKWKWGGYSYSALSLHEYITRSPPHGLGATIEQATDWVRRDPLAYAMFTKETTGKVGRPSKETHDNVMIKAQQGNSRAYRVKRLRENHPELFALVCKGKLSVNQAAIKAGFAPKKPSAFDQIKKLVPKLSTNERAELLDILDDDGR